MKLKVYRYSELSEARLQEICRRNPLEDEEILALCREVFDSVRNEGDAAVRRYTKQFDGVELEELRVDPRELQEAVAATPEEVQQALREAAANIRKFHSAQLVGEDPVQVTEGVTCWRAVRAINAVGLYVPAGTAPLPSTVLMLGIPAKLAGCRKILLCVPPQLDGTVSSVVLAAAQIAGIRHVFRVGGAQAVAAMALGTESIPRVDKIFGPGNRYVQTAKLLATHYGVAIDMIAGPSEVLVIADAAAPPEVVAADLLSQAEHGADSQAVLVTDAPALVDAVEEELKRQLADLPRRELAEASLRQSFALLVDDFEQAFTFSNLYAPEHLIINLMEPREWLSRVESAGSVFVGTWTPEVAGDYASGTNHTLPTSGLARSMSGVSMESFVKRITFQELQRAGLRKLAPTLTTLAEVEGLEGHARAVRYRLEESQG
ncbi:MAG: histidinol dehydrogenase [Acidobacteriota bacterium]